MNAKLEIKADWERLEIGPPEERTTFAAIGIRYNDLWLTEAEDAFVKRVRQQVHLSGYRLAEWFAWNWWRLRWEPRGRSTDWALAHRMSTIGGGYIWPNITIVSDGERIAFDAHGTVPRPEEPLRYIARFAAIVSAREFEVAIDRFVEQVAGQLREESIANTNLATIWTDLQFERRSPEVAIQRKFEALLGCDPDDANQGIIERLVADSTELGLPGMEELAADRTFEGKPATFEEVRQIAQVAGFDFSVRDAVQLEERRHKSLPAHDAAWKRGVAAARALREQEKLGEEPISNDRLCRLIAVPNTAAEADERRGPLSFALYDSPTTGRVVLRSKLETGRRFNLGRLLGDRVAAGAGGRLLPATRTYTYRQKLQRAFAGEFLCPFDALADILRGDFSAEVIEDAAAKFNVSERTVRTLLVNHRLIDRHELAQDFDVVA